MSQSSAAGGNGEGKDGSEHRQPFERLRDFVDALPDDDEDAAAAKAALKELTTKPALGKKVSKGETLRVLSQRNLRLIRPQANGISGLCQGYNWRNNISQNTSQRIPRLISPQSVDNFTLYLTRTHTPFLPLSYTISYTNPAGDPTASDYGSETSSIV